MPIAGAIPPVPGLSARKRQAELSYTQWKRDIPRRNQTIIDRVLKTQGSELSLLCWEKTLAEVRAGWVTEPIDLNDALAGSTPLTPRFAIREQHGEQKPKIRLIDDFRASEINAIVETVDTNIPDSLDVFTALTSYFKLVAPECQLMCSTMDFDG